VTISAATLRHKFRQKVMEQLFKVSQSNMSPSVLINRFLPLCITHGKLATGAMPLRLTNPNL